MYTVKFCLDLRQFLEFTDRLHAVIVTVCVLNALIAAPATIGNAAVLVAIKRFPSLHRPSYILIAALALTDLGVGFLVQPLHILFKVAEMRNMDMFCQVGASYKVVAITFSGASFLTILAISLDRLLAVLLGVRYRTIVTVKRVYLALLVMLLLSLGLGFIHIINMKAYYAAAGLVCLLSLIWTTFNYIKIAHILHKQQVRINHQDRPVKFPQTRSGFNLGRYKRSVSSMTFVCVFFLLCYIPYLFVMIVKLFTGTGPVIQGATYITDTIVFMNSAINPALYYWRMPEIRRAVRKLCKKEESSVITTTGFGP